LHDLGGARAADLSDCFGIDKGLPSHQLKLLEDLQFITFQTDTADHRSHRLTLTADGPPGLGVLGASLSAKSC
jgi:DNA-binding MarR family transcriptional regulator